MKGTVRSFYLEVRFISVDILLKEKQGAFLSTPRSVTAFSVIYSPAVTPSLALSDTLDGQVTEWFENAAVFSVSSSLLDVHVTGGFGGHGKENDPPIHKFPSAKTFMWILL